MSKTIKVIFLKDSIWGKRNEQKNHKKGFVHWLINQNLVLPANETNIKKLSKEEGYNERVNQLNREKNIILCNSLNGLELNFALQKDEKNKVFGSVTYKALLQELEKKEFFIQKKQLLNFKPIKSLGETGVRINLDKNIEAIVKVIIS